MINSIRGAVLATTRQCACEWIWVVIDLLLYVTCRQPQRAFPTRASLIQGGIHLLRMDSWLAQKTAYRLDRVPLEVWANES